MGHNPAMTLPELPITGALPEMLARLRASGVVVLQAPPGAGKTTLVPLALLDGSLARGKIVMLEPRRLAARAAAERMAALLGETVGETVGYRVRGQSRCGPKTRIEVVTEGILTRMIQSDPSLAGIDALIFDEFHERSLHADLGLALAIEARAALREDLKLIVMSATLDAAPVADLLDAPIVTSEGKAYPVRTIRLERPRPRGQRLEEAMAGLVRRALGETEGGILAFLPGEGEIRRTQALLQQYLPPEVQIQPLFGAMKMKDQQAALAPAAPGRRKLVLATSIAETSLTIPDIRVVVDCGLARRARFDPGSGMSALVTERLSRAEAEQRRGRAGRVAPGWCYRLWTRGEEGAMPLHAPPEILTADLAPLALEMALWGAREAGELALLTPPPEGPLAAARALLRNLGALGEDGAITDHGRKLAAMPLHPRLAHMLANGGPDAPLLAALLSERDPLGGGRGASGCDLELRRRALEDPQAQPAELRPALQRIRAEARQLGRFAGRSRPTGWPFLAALAYPDRIGLRRPGDAPRWLLSGGKGARMDPADPLAGARLIVVTDQAGEGGDMRIRQAIALDDATLEAAHGKAFRRERLCAWSKREGRVISIERQCFGALVLQERPWKDAPPDAAARAALAGLREDGLPLGSAARRFIARVGFARRQHPDLPDLSAQALLDDMEGWLLPHLIGKPPMTLAGIRALDLLPALKARLSWEQSQRLDAAAPEHWQSPAGRRIPVEYESGTPQVSVRLQECFGLAQHPQIGGQPLRITLLSPAGRPLQTTTDLPGFWAGSYADVRKEMRGRYPKHRWPEDPLSAAPGTHVRHRNN